MGVITIFLLCILTFMTPTSTQTVAPSLPPTSPLPWKALFSPTPPAPISPLSLPPELLCKPILDIPKLVETYHSLNLIIIILQKIMFSNIDTALLTETIDDVLTTVYYVESTESNPPVQLEASTACGPGGKLYRLISSHWSYVTAVLATRAKTTKKLIAMKVDFEDESKTPTTKDGRIITIPNQVFSVAHPYILHTPTGMKFGSAELPVNIILCKQISTTLTEELSTVQHATKSSILALESQTASIRELLHHTIPNHSNYNLQITPNQTAKLIGLRNQNSPESCLEVKISLSLPISNFSLPTLIKPANQAKSTAWLQDRLSESFTLADELILHLNLLKTPITKPPITISYSLETYKDIFKYLPSPSTMRTLLIILLCSLGGTVILFTLMFLLLLYFLRRGAMILSRTPPDERRILNLVYNPSIPPSAPLLSLQEIQTNQSQI